MSRISTKPERLENCACFVLRKAARAVTRSFDGALASSGLEATQFTVLAALAGRERTMSRLAGHLVLDRTTLSRNLAPLIRAGLVAARRGRDGRQRIVKLTGAGLRKLKETIPAWRAAQANTISRVGRARFVRLLEGLAVVTSAAAGAQYRTVGRRSSMRGS